MSVTMDTQQLVLPDLPPEWDPVEPEVLRMLEPDTRGLFTPAQLNLQDDLIAKRWFLVSNSLAWRCKNCRSGLPGKHSLPGDIHPYITRGCIPRPFNGLNEVLMFWRTRINDTTVESWTMRVGENLIPISVDRAQAFYQEIEYKTGKDLAWVDFYARYVRRYRSYLRSLGWSMEQFGERQWREIIRLARHDYVIWRKDGTDNGRG